MLEDPDILNKNKSEELRLYKIICYLTSPGLSLMIRFCSHPKRSGELGSYIDHPFLFCLRKVFRLHLGSIVARIFN
jgi:hypothetical protein